MIQVGVAAPALALRLGLREVLQRLPEITVAGEAALPADLPPADVWVLAGFSARVDLGDEPPPVLLLTQGEDRFTWVTELPVWGLLPLDAAPEELLATLRALAEGLVAGAPALLRRLAQRAPEAQPANAEAVADPLTARERQVLQLAAEGLANKEIALALQISEHTVKFHLSSLYSKLGVASRTESIRAGTRRGWVVL